MLNKILITFFILIFHQTIFPLIKYRDINKIKLAKDKIKINKCLVRLNVSIHKNIMPITPRHNMYFIRISIVCNNKAVLNRIMIEKLWMHYKGKLTRFTVDKNRTFRTKNKISITYIMSPNYIKYIAIKISYKFINFRYLKTGELRII